MNSHKKEIFQRYTVSPLPENKINKDALVFKEILFTDKEQTFKFENKISADAFVIEERKHNKAGFQRGEWKKENKEHKPRYNNQAQIQEVKVPAKDLFIEKIGSYVEPIDSVEMNLPKMDKVDINSILSINKHLDILYTLPLWYIKHPSMTVVLGPFSSTQIIDMFTNNIITVETEIRMIDSFVVQRNFAFYKLNDILHPEFIKYIQVSSSAMNYINKNKPKEQTNETHLKKEESENFLQNNAYVYVNRPNEDEFIEVKKHKKATLKKDYFPDKAGGIVGVRKENAETEAKEKKETKQIFRSPLEEELESAPKTKKPKFKTKGKPVEADIKTGFIFK